MVVIGAGVGAFRPPSRHAIKGASVIIVEANHDIGGRGMLSGRRLRLGGGNASSSHGIKDSADQVYADWVRFDSNSSR